MSYIQHIVPDLQIKDKCHVGRHFDLSYITGVFDNNWSDHRIPISNNHGQTFLAQLQKNGGIYHKVDIEIMTDC